MKNLKVIVYFLISQTIICSIELMPSAGNIRYINASERSPFRFAGIVYESAAVTEPWLTPSSSPGFFLSHLLSGHRHMALKNQQVSILTLSLRSACTPMTLDLATDQEMLLSR